MFELTHEETFSVGDAAELSDEVIERLHEEGSSAAQRSAGPFVAPDCPYDEDSKEAEIWLYAYRKALESDWH
jgi:hypothetical protein